MRVISEETYRDLVEFLESNDVFGRAEELKEEAIEVRELDDALAVLATEYEGECWIRVAEPDAEVPDDYPVLDADQIFR